MTEAPGESDARTPGVYGPNDIPEDVRKAVTAAFESIPHVVVETVSWNMVDRGAHPVAITADTYAMHVVIRGWSPTGHAGTIYCEARLDQAAEEEAGGDHAKLGMIRAVMAKDTALGGSMLARLALAGFGPRLEEQRARHEAALRRGQDEPYRVVPIVERTPDMRTATAHVLIDRGIAALIDERVGGGDRDERLVVVESMISDTHSDRQSFDYEVNASWPGAVEAMVHDGPPVAKLRVKIKLSEDASICDNIVDIRRMLPDAVAAAAVGRPLGDLVEVTPAIADRTIAEVRPWGTMTSVILQVDDARVEDLWQGFRLRNDGTLRSDNTSRGEKR